MTDPDVIAYLVIREQSDPLHLVEDGVVTGVDLIPPVNISGQQEGIQARPHQLPLVGGGVGAEHRGPAPHTSWKVHKLRPVKPANMHNTDRPDNSTDALWAMSSVTHLFR